MAEASNSVDSGYKLAGKVAIITGGASGIGEATARLFADQGARMVVIADIQDDLGNQVAASIGTHRSSKFLHINSCTFFPFPSRIKINSTKVSVQNTWHVC